jgi:type IV pilus biogenesis protein PilP
MSRKGPRQDVAFLALAVAVLAIAVALFVGIRALSNRRAPEPVAPPVPQVAQKPVAGEPPGSKTHDPFQGKPTQPPKPAAGATAPAGAKGKAKPADEIKLVGVIQGQGKELLAAIRRGNRRYYAKQGDTVAGYTVVHVQASQVVLAKGAETMTLLLRKPPEGESE